MGRELQVTFDCADPAALSGFWAGVLGFVVYLVPEGKSAKNRVHLDVRVAPRSTGDERMAVLEHECERLQVLGATRLTRHEPRAPAAGRPHRPGRSRGQRVLPRLTGR